MTSPAKKESRGLSQQAHRRLIGVLGLFMPVMLYVVAGWRHTEGLPPWVLLDSVSAYYYTGAVGIFVGVLFALSLFLFTYQGYEGEKWDRVLGAISGTAALGIALFPTTPPGSVTPPTWWTAKYDSIHLTSAYVLFGAFILFAIWLFRKSSVPPDKRPPDKVWRNRVCLWCGLAMIGAVIWAFVSRPKIFWPETTAISAFAISWLVKGDVHEPLIAAFRSVRRRLA